MENLKTVRRMLTDPAGLWQCSCTA